MVRTDFVQYIGVFDLKSLWADFADDGGRQCRWENKIFWGETTLHNSQGAEYVDGKGTGLMNLGGDEE